MTSVVQDDEFAPLDGFLLKVHQFPLQAHESVEAGDLPLVDLEAEVVFEQVRQLVDLGDAAELVTGPGQEKTSHGDVASSDGRHGGVDRLLEAVLEAREGHVRRRVQCDVGQGRRRRPAGQGGCGFRKRCGGQRGRSRREEVFLVILSRRSAMDEHIKSMIH